MPQRAAQPATSTAKERKVIEIIEVREPWGTDFYVYQGAKLVRVCPSIGMANEVAAGL